MNKPHFGNGILIGTLLLVALSRPIPPEPPPEKPLAMELDRDRVRTLGVLLRVVSEEMIATAESENIEEHLIAKSEQIFDDFAKERDFIGPDRITKPLVRRMVRPIARAVIRYIDKKSRELSRREEEE